jgi:hypothetical protein
MAHLNLPARQTMASALRDQAIIGAGAGCNRRLRLSLGKNRNSCGGSKNRANARANEPARRLSQERCRKKIGGLFGRARGRFASRNEARPKKRRPGKLTGPRIEV